MAIPLAIAEGISPHLLIILQDLLQSSDAHVRLGIPVESSKRPCEFMEQVRLSLSWSKPKLSPTIAERWISVSIIDK